MVPAASVIWLDAVAPAEETIKVPSVFTVIPPAKVLLPTLRVRLLPALCAEYVSPAPPDHTPDCVIEPRVLRVSPKVLNTTAPNAMLTIVLLVIVAVPLSVMVPGVHVGDPVVKFNPALSVNV